MYIEDSTDVRALEIIKLSKGQTGFYMINLFILIICVPAFVQYHNNSNNSREVVVAIVTIGVVVV